MLTSQLSVTAPALNFNDCGEAEVFGAVTWLALHAKTKSRLPLSSLSQWLTPALGSQQYLLLKEQVGEQSRPVGFMSWAALTPQAEALYVHNPDSPIPHQDWTAGDRLWVIDWFTPFGHSQAFSRLARELMGQRCLRSLYHRGGERGLRVQQFRGSQISLPQAKQWWKARPIQAVQAIYS